MNRLSQVNSGTKSGVIQVAGHKKKQARSSWERRHLACKIAQQSKILLF
jgi:hypothetical protein